MKYQLVNIFEPNGFWQQALHEASMTSAMSSTFHAWGTFKGNNSGGCGRGAIFASCNSNSANAPWGWNDGNDGASYRGEFALHPTNLVDHYFNGVGNFSHRYINNRYAQDLQNAGFNSSYKPQGWSDSLDLNTLYTKLIHSCP